MSRQLGCEQCPHPFPSLLSLCQAAATAQTHPQLLQAFSADPELLMKQISLTVLLFTLCSGLGVCDLGSFWLEKSQEGMLQELT